MVWLARQDKTMASFLPIGRVHTMVSLHLYVRLDLYIASLPLYRSSLPRYFMASYTSIGRVFLAIWRVSPCYGRVYLSIW